MTSSEKKALDQVLSELRNLKTRFSALEKSYRSTPDTGSKSTNSGSSKLKTSLRGTCYKGKQRGHKKADCPLNS